MNILDKIVENTRKRVALLNHPPLPSFNVDYRKDKAAFDFEKALADKAAKKETAFICEVKKASPSKGVIAEDFPYINIARDYEAGGAAAVSVLTEPDFFLGSNDYLAEIRQAVNIPLLRKDFIIDERQIYEARLIGASAVLLITALLDTKTLEHFIGTADSLGLSCLVETRDEAEIDAALEAGARIIGVNNRDLKTFKVDIGTAVKLRPLVPDNVLFIAESGIKTAQDVALLRQNGVYAVLIGETLMTAGDRKKALRELSGT